MTKNLLQYALLFLLSLYSTFAKSQCCDLNTDSSSLPIILINTFGQNIIQNTKRDAWMEIKYNGAGNHTFFSDDSNVYDGEIGIEIRGASSANYPQTPFGLETRDAEGENNNVALLGMPAENDWVLLSNYNDRSLVRNALAYKMFGEMGNYSVRTSLCEVLINESYQGIYLFGEKIKRDSNRVNIAKLTEDDISGNDLTGGYILQQNKWNSNNSFLSNFSPIDYPNLPIRFLYEYPKYDEILEVQKESIAGYIDSLETALYSAEFADTVAGYRKYLDIKSFIDYFIVNEVARNADGFKKSVFFHKDKYSRGGKLKAGPVWDFDWAWKNLDACFIYAVEDGSGWAHHNNDCPTDVSSSGWYIRMLQDCGFADELRTTYEEYRQTILDTNYIFAYIDSIGNLVEKEQVRHFQKWPILGISGPAPELGSIATTYAGELETLKAWITNRLEWLDVEIPNLCNPVSATEDTINAEEVLTCFPNPASDFVEVVYSLSSPTFVTISLVNSVGAEVISTVQGVKEEGQHRMKFETKGLPVGMYILLLKTDDFAVHQKLILVREL